MRRLLCVSVLVLLLSVPCDAWVLRIEVRNAAQGARILNAFAQKHHYQEMIEEKG
jgi:hypothetical protein